ncbi:hypothetical protein [Algoriphagus formosus]|uniref:hypothetical protein n=1 Tax=Algoriphagus formosus TaxID=2007308 RepID=UPI0012FD4C1F|nr:hypothetical protein [Algoriphagus formosus]
MELEEMKILWGELSGKAENQEKIKKEELMKMTKKKYQNSLGTIYLPEILGAVICFVYAGFFIFQIDKLELQVNQIFAVFNTVLMIILPIISLVMLYRFNRLNISENSPVQLLEKFKKDKRFYRDFQIVTIVLSGLFAMTILPPLAELMGKADMVSNPQFWMVYVPIGVIFIFIFGRWTLKKYTRALDKAQEVIEGIE